MGYSLVGCKKLDTTEHALIQGNNTKYTEPLITTAVCTCEFCTIAAINGIEYDFSESQDVRQVIGLRKASVNLNQRVSRFNLKNIL